MPARIVILFSLFFKKVWLYQVIFIFMKFFLTLFIFLTSTCYCIDVDLMNKEIKHYCQKSTGCVSNIQKKINACPNKECQEDIIRRIVEKNVKYTMTYISSSKFLPEKDRKNYVQIFNNCKNIKCKRDLIRDIISRANKIVTQKIVKYCNKKGSCEYIHFKELNKCKRYLCVTEIGYSIDMKVINEERYLKKFKLTREKLAKIYEEMDERYRQYYKNCQTVECKNKFIYSIEENRNEILEAQIPDDMKNCFKSDQIRRYYLDFIKCSRDDFKCRKNALKLHYPNHRFFICVRRCIFPNLSVLDGYLPRTGCRHNEKRKEAYFNYLEGLKEKYPKAYCTAKYKILDSESSPRSFYIKTHGPVEYQDLGCGVIGYGCNAKKIKIYDLSANEYAKCSFGISCISGPRLQTPAFDKKSLEGKIIKGEYTFECPKGLSAIVNSIKNLSHD